MYAKHDNIADIEGVRIGFKIALKSYQEQGVPDNIVLIESEGGHKFYPELAWPVIQKMKNEILSNYSTF